MIEHGTDMAVYGFYMLQSNHILPRQSRHYVSFRAEQAIADDSETGSSAERFVKQPSRLRPSAEPVSNLMPDPEPAGESQH